MRVIADRSICQGYSQCSFAAPSVFELDEDGHVNVLLEEPDERLRADVEEAVSACPVQAITVRD